jgi:hypothetical protein
MKSSTRYWTGGLTVFAACCIGINGAVSQAPSPAEIARSSIVYIYLDVTDPGTGAIKHVQGTGFIVSKTGYVLTAAHLFREWVHQRDVDKKNNVIKSSLRDKPGRSLIPPLDLSIVDHGDPDGTDVALLRLPDSGPEYTPASICRSRTPHIGDNFTAYGFPFDNPFQPVPGTLGTGGGPGGRYLATSAFDHGMSGGPIYDSNGVVVGLVEGGLDSDAVRWITPIGFAENLFAIARVPDSCDPGPSPWSFGNCQADAEAARTDYAIDPSNIVRADGLIKCKNPIGYQLRGADSFYRGNYKVAAENFELALKNLPPQGSDTLRPLWQSDLADAYVEIGRTADAISLYQQVLNATGADWARFGLARGNLYQGRDVPGGYDEAVEQLRAVDPSFRGPLKPGVVQIALSAAEVGRIYNDKMNKQQRNASMAQAKSDLCAGIKKSEDYWRAVLKGTEPVVHYSFKEEIRLTAELGGWKISCPA